MASTAVAVAVGTVGMDGDKMKSIYLDGREREREREICIMVTIQQLSNVRKLASSSSANLVLSEQLLRNNLILAFLSRSHTI